MNPRAKLVITVETARLSPRQRTNVWMITFADLMALLLAFCVLIFSMSDFKSNSWDDVVSALSADLVPMASGRASDEAATTGVFLNQGDLDDPRAGYLMSLLSTRFETQIQSGDLSVSKSANTVILLLGQELVLRDDLSDESETWLSQLAIFLGALREPVSILVPGSQGNSADGILSLSKTLERGEMVFQTMRGLGYPKSMAIFAAASDTGEQTNHVRLQIETGRR